MKTIVEIRFGADRIPGGLEAILSPSGCGRDVIKVTEYMIGGGVNRLAIDVTMTLDDSDERVPKVLSLLAEYSEAPWVARYDIYSEDDLQSAPLLQLNGWSASTASGGAKYGTTYDKSNACPTCGTGIRQTSPLILQDDEMRRVDKHRIASTYHNDVLVRETDVERLLDAEVTGALFWPASFKRKSGELTEVRWQQAVIESVLPPMTTNSSLERKGVCPMCRRGGYTTVFQQPSRLFYRAEDLANAKDFNLSWEWFGDYRKEGEMQRELWPNPFVFVTPKVMNLLRGKTKKEQKYQGCDFIPIWIEDEKTGRVSLA